MFFAQILIRFFAFARTGHKRKTFDLHLRALDTNAKLLFCICAHWTQTQKRKKHCDPHFRYCLSRQNKQLEKNTQMRVAMFLRFCVCVQCAQMQIKSFAFVSSARKCKSKVLRLCPVRANAKRIVFVVLNICAQNTGDGFTLRLRLRLVSGNHVPLGTHRKNAISDAIRNCKNRLTTTEKKCADME